jgi:hypothetical protein
VALKAESARDEALRPRSVGQLLDGTFQLYRRHWLLFVAVLAILRVPLRVLQVVDHGVGGSTFDLFGALFSRNFSELLKQSQGQGSNGLITAFSTIVGAIEPAVLVALCAGLALNQTSGVREAYRLGMRRTIPLFLTNILVVLPLSLLCLTVIGIPFAIYLGLGWALVTEVVVLERGSGRAALRRSGALVRGHRWRAVGMLYLPVMIQVVLSSSPSALVAVARWFAVSVLGAGPEVGWYLRIFEVLTTTASGVLFGAFSSIALTLFYFDLRVRQEGLDLEQRILQGSGGQIAEPAS